MAVHKRSRAPVSTRKQSSTGREQESPATAKRQLLTSTHWDLWSVHTVIARLIPLCRRMYLEQRAMLCAYYEALRGAARCVAVRGRRA
jgi:hypothetical protein